MHLVIALISASLSSAPREVVKVAAIPVAKADPGQNPSRFTAFHPCALDSADLLVEHTIRSIGHPEIDGRFAEGFRLREFRGEEAHRQFLASRHSSIREPMNLPVAVDSEGHPTITRESVDATFSWIFEHIGRGFNGVVGKTSRRSLAKEGLRFTLSTSIDRRNSKRLELRTFGDIVVRDTLALNHSDETPFKADTSFCTRSKGVSLCSAIKVVSREALKSALRTSTTSWKPQARECCLPSLAPSDSGTAYRVQDPVRYLPLR